MRGKVTLNQVPKYIFDNYFWLITLTALLNVSTGIGWLSTLILPLVIYFCMFQSYRAISFNLLDVLWVVLFFWMILTWTYNDYPNQEILILRCVGTQIAYMMAYWIARNASKDQIATIIGKAYIPLTITAIIGIYCFFFRPSWYVHIIEMHINNKEGPITENRILEAYRLRSIFSSPYTLSYFCGITLIYEMFLIIKKRIKYETIHYMFMGLLIITSLLAMQRAPFLSAILGILIALVYGNLYTKITKPIKVFVVAFIIGSVVVPIVFSSMNKSTNEFFISKILAVTEESDQFVERRLYLNQKDSEVIGDGVGRHNMYAEKYNQGTTMRDGEYMKIIQEQGYIGLGLFLVIMTIALIKCLTNFKHLSFELCLLLMLLICMIGANPLSTGDKHSIIYWMALGRIARYDDKLVIMKRYKDLIKTKFSRKASMLSIGR